MEDLLVNEDFLEVLALVDEVRTGGGPVSEYTYENLTIAERSWMFTGLSTGGNNARSIGFLRQIDWSKDSGEFVHDLMPPLPSEPGLYDEYSPFKASDVMNGATATLNALRLEGGAILQTDTPETFSNVSFYASRGLARPGETLASNRTFSVEVSLDGNAWTTLGTETLSDPVDSEEFDYDQYVFSVPETLEGDSLYLRIVFNGQAGNKNTDPNISRMVIDGLTIE